MKISVKVRVRAGKTPAAVVRDRMKQLPHKAGVEEVFPGETTGHRAGLVVVDLPDHLSDDESEQVLKHLRDDRHIEYAERSTPRRRK